MNQSTFLLVLFFPILVAAQTNNIQPVVQFGHLGAEIKELVISADGSLMATTDGVIVKLWDMKTGLEIRSLAEDNRPSEKISHLCLSADANIVGYIFSNQGILRRTEDGTFLRQYPDYADDETDDLTDGSEEQERKNAEKTAEKNAAREAVFALAIHPKDNRVALMMGSRVEIRDIDTDQILYSVPCRSAKPAYHLSANGFRFSPDGLFLTSQTGGVSYKGDRAYDYKMPLFKTDTLHYDYAIRGGILTEDGKYALLAFSKLLKIDSIQRRLTKEYEEKLKRDSTFLDEEENIRDDNTGEVSIPLFSLLKAIEVYMDNFAKSGTILISEAATGKILHRIDTTGISDLRLSPDSKVMATAHQKGYAIFWDLQTLKGISTVKIEQVVEKNPFFKMPPPNPQIVFTPDSRSAVIAAKFVDEENIALYDVATGQKVRSIGADIPLVNIGINQVSNNRVDLREFVELSNNNFFLPVRYELDRGYRQFNLENGKVPSSFPKHDSVTYSPYRDYYFLQKRGDLGKVFNAELNYQVSILENSAMSLKNACFSHDGRYVAASHKHTFMVWDVQSGERIYYNDRHELLVNHLSFDPNDQYIASCGEDRRVGFWDIQEPAEEPQASVGPSFKQTLFAKSLRNRGKLIHSAKTTLGKAGSSDIGEKSPIKVIKIPTLNIPNPITRTIDKTRHTLETVEKVNKRVTGIEKLLQFNGGYDVSYSEDGRFAAVWLNNYSSVKVFELVKDTSGTKKGPKIKLKERAKNAYNRLSQKGSIKEMGTIKDWQLAVMQKYIFGGRQKDQNVSPTDSAYMAYVWLNSFKRQFNLRYLSAFSSDYARLARYQTTYSLSGEGRGLKKMRKSEVKSKKGIRIQCVGGGCKDLWLPESEGFNEGLALGGDFVAASNRATNTIKVWNAQTGQFVKAIPGHSGKLRFSPNGKVLFSSGWDRQVKAFDFDSGKELYRFIGIKGSRDYVIMLPNGYYTASRRNSKAVAFVKGKHAYPFEQFDLYFNRPDSLVMLFGESCKEILGTGNPNRALAEAYSNARIKRIENLGYETGELLAESHLPEITLVKVPASQPGTTLNLAIKANDGQFPLDRLQIYVNDVPVFGTKGFDLKTKQPKTYEGTHKVTLVPGSNRVQVSVFNVKGAESLRETALINCTAPAQKPTLYLVLLGAARFKDSTMNLSSPINDLKVIEAMFKGKATDYAEIVPISLYDQAFTRDNFNQVKIKLKKAASHDRIVVVVATHGLLDARYNYFLATYDTDFKNPSAAALPYRELEAIFDGVQARQRLVLLDACHAGELDTISLQNLQNAQKRTNGLQYRSFPSSTWNKVGYQESFDLMKDLFIDLRRGSGATIIGSAKGSELALDGGPAGKISPFTYALIKALKDLDADGVNQDQQVTVSELQEYLGRKVQDLTGGVQRPIYRVENVGNDWRVW
jgi:WD40 repeat protein